MDDPDSANTSGDTPWVDPWLEQRGDGKTPVGPVRATVWICAVVAVIGLLSAGTTRLGSLFPQESAEKPQVAPTFMPPLPFDDLGKQPDPEPVWELPGGAACVPVDPIVVFPQESAGNVQVAPEVS